MHIDDKKINRIISESIQKVIGEDSRSGNGGKQPSFDRHHPANKVKLGYDKNLRYGDDWVKNGGNFMVMRNGREYYVSRNTSVSLYTFAKDINLPLIISIPLYCNIGVCMYYLNKEGRCLFLKKGVWECTSQQKCFEN